MEHDLKDLFERTLADEPPPPADVAEEAMIQGTRLRRSRTLRAAGGLTLGVVAVLAAALAFTVPGPGGTDTPSTSTAAPAGSGAPRTCVPVRKGPDAVDAYVVLTPAVTEQQRAGLLTALRADPLVRTVSYQGGELAFERFQELWRDSPDVVRSVPPSQSELFLVELRDRDSYPEFTARHVGAAGVADVVDWRTPAARDAGTVAQVCSDVSPGAGE